MRAMVEGIERGLAVAAAERPGTDREAVLQRFLKSISRNDDEAVIATENLFFALRSSQEGPVWASVLGCPALCPRPQAILLARIWHSGRPDILEVADPQKQIVPLFRRARDLAGDVLMGGDWPEFQSLPERLIIYRGSRDRRADLNPSWTLDPMFAAYFVLRHSAGADEPRRLISEIAKSHVLAFFNLCGEREVVVDPAGLINPRPFEPQE